MNAGFLVVFLMFIASGMAILPAYRADKRDARPCYCGGLYDCEACGNDTCKCECDTDGAPQTNHGVMA